MNGSSRNTTTDIDDDTRWYNDPTPDEIRERCKLIRKSWTAAKRKRRKRECLPPSWAVPLVPLADLSQLTAPSEDLSRLAALAEDLWS
jgi:hypothetical protein